MAIFSRGPAIDAFFQRYLVLPTGRRAGEPFVMEGWQRRFTNYFHQLVRDSEREAFNRVFRLGVLGIPRGNGKSPMAAGYGLYELVSRRDAPHVYCLAASKSQASVVHDFGRAFVEASPLQKHGVRSGRLKITFDRRRAFFEVLTTSGLNVHGKNPATLIGDETHALITPIQKETWVGMWTAMHKRDNPYALMITTAGGKKDTLLGETYDEALKLPLAPIKHTNPCLRIHEDRENGVLFWWYGIPEELHHRWDDEMLWRHANPATWIRIEDLRKQLNAPGFSELDFQRLHLNMWVAAKARWLRTGVWAGLVGDREPFARGTQIWVGVDIGWTDDSSAVVWACRTPAGKIALRAKIWTVRRDQVGEFVPGGRMDLELVEDFILELKRRYRVKEVAYDPIYFGRSAAILRKKGGFKDSQLIEMPPMHAHTRAAWTLMKQYAESGGLEHDGDPDFAAHINDVGEEMGKTGPRVTKAASGKIDGAAAAVLAVSRCDLAGQTAAAAKVFWMQVDGEPADAGDGDADR